MDYPEVARRPPFGGNPEVGARGVTTQRSILTAALTVFADHGFHDAKVEDIAEAAGCSRPAFYQYFASKEDVFWRLAGHLGRELADLVDQLGRITPDAGGVATLDRWIDALVDLHQSYRPVFLSFPTAFRETDPGQPLPRSLAARFQEILADAGAVHGAGPGDVQVRALAEATVTTTLRTVHYWMLGLFSIPRTRFTAGLAATIHRVIHGPLAGVNTGPVVDPPSHTVPPWPVATTELPQDRTLRARGVVTRQKLLDAAGIVLPRRGYHETRVDDIVTEAGVSHGSFYRYFDSTDQVFRVLALETSRQMADLVDAFPTGPDATLRDWLQRWFDAYRSNGGVLSAWEEIELDNPGVSTMSLELTLVFLDRLARLVHTRGFGDTAVDAVALLSVIERIPYTVVVLGHLGEGPALMAARHLIERGILGTPPTR